MKFVFLKYTYKSIDALYADDIAVIVLQTNAIISTIVSPACMYWKNYNRFNIESGSLGKVNREILLKQVSISLLSRYLVDT